MSKFYLMEFRLYKWSESEFYIKDEYEAPFEDDYGYLRVTELTEENLCLANLHEVIDYNLENMNNESLLGISTIIVDAVAESINYEAAIKVMWYMLNTYGLDWNNFLERS